MTKTNGKQIKAKEIFTWIFDITFVSCLIWYFAIPGHTEVFWSGASCSFHKAVTFVASKLHSFQTSMHGDQIALPSTAASSTSTAPTTTSTPPPPMFTPPPLPTAAQLATEVNGDCFPPEVRSAADARAIANLFYQPDAIPKPEHKRRDPRGKPIQITKKKIKGVPLYLVTIDLQDPESFIVIRLPRDSQQANCTDFTAGHEELNSFVIRCHAAAIMNGTFFSKDEQERVMGNMVSEGKSLKYSQWENYGTTLGLREGNYPEMITARAEGKPDWNSHWFSLTCGPRLLKEGAVWLNPELEGFTDSHVLGIGSRCAIGFPKTRDKLYLVSFMRGLSLQKEAELMQSLGCYEAMNLDGGASKGLAQDTNIIMKPGRPLTNVLVIYDSKHKAPDDVVASWRQFQKSDALDPNALQ
ncbi:MAG TPA: phosphodiester glycosidase family protein [Candidatus Obscuribacterales bacterium]